MVKEDQGIGVASSKSTALASKTLAQQTCSVVSLIAFAGAVEKNWVMVCWVGDILCTARKSLTAIATASSQCCFATADMLSCS
eukprot:15343352-Ditylum_brightwellii.AAC.1